MNEQHGGERAELTQAIVFGRYTVVEFTSQNCPGCREMKSYLETLYMSRPDIVVRVYDIDRPGCEGIDWDSPLAKQHNIHSVPGFIIFNEKGVKIADGPRASEQVKDVIRQTLR